ncbi:MAG: hypothetical protein KJO64_04475 [Bacteroidia bacterium]|nr:hypothetical protein [Bacteroidia bacterium]NNC84619.1 hypothetical protein [Bacteroidia bacterium]
MNIIEEIKLDPDKPNILSIQKTNKINLMAVGLLQNQMLKKHKTQIPTLLTVLKGAITFYINNESMHLGAFDTLQIPVNTEHEAKGMESENVFTLMQEK